MNLLGRPEDHDPNDVWVVEDARRGVGGPMAMTATVSLLPYAEPPLKHEPQGRVAPVGEWKRPLADADAILSRGVDRSHHVNRRAVARQRVSRLERSGQVTR